MKSASIASRTLWIAAALCLTRQAHSEGNSLAYRGMCDASAAVALGDDHFVVADDESNALRVYRRGEPNASGMVDLGAFLEAGKEVDLEGAAVIDERIYWITSHGRDKKANPEPQRLRFFATNWESGPTPTLSPAGKKPYTALLDDLLKADEGGELGLTQGSKLAPEAVGGLNIEGLAATPEGKLLIGFRNPLPEGMAIIVPLENPQDLIDGNGPAKFGKPIRLKLGGRGIRSIEHVGDRIGGSYLLVAGPTGDEGSFSVYRWSGKASDDATALPDVNLQNLRAEALFAIPRKKQIQLLSDDGGVEIGGKECKKLKDPAEKSFGSAIVDL